MSPRLAELYPNAFVTGASAGLGRAFAIMLLGEGVRVWGTARDVGRLTAIAGRFPAIFTPVALDLGEPFAAEAAFRRAANSAGGAFDLVVNNAGYGVFGMFHEVDYDSWQKQLDAMVGTTFRLTHAALQGMHGRNRGCVLNVSSLAAEFPLPFMAGYNVAKSALSALSESLIVETRGTGIKVIDFRPGDYLTDFNRTMLTTSPAGHASGPLTTTAWNALEAHRAASPSVEMAARDFRRALLGAKSGVVRSGSFFQARVAPLFARLLPSSMLRRISDRYYGL
ncbi:MAG: SDR family NAD(P)-dependent oxidoreductase [Opitutus sp.]